MHREFSGKDFVKSMSQGSLKPTLIIRGMVKPGDDPTFLLFSGDGRCKKWIKIAVDLIEKVTYLGETQCKDHTHQIAALQLRDPAPTNPEAALFAELFQNVSQALARLEKRVVAEAVRSQSSGDVGSMPVTKSHLPTGESTWECLWEVCHGWGCTHYCLFGAP